MAVQRKVVRIEERARKGTPQAAPVAEPDALCHREFLVEVQIFEACSFQDLTSQRVANVVATLKTIEDGVARLQTIWQTIECFKPVVLGEAGVECHGYLNGPKLPDDRGHSTQDDIDGMFVRA